MAVYLNTANQPDGITDTETHTQTDTDGQADTFTHMQTCKDIDAVLSLTFHS